MSKVAKKTALKTWMATFCMLAASVVVTVTDAPPAQAADNVPCVQAGSLYSSSSGVFSTFKSEDPSSTPPTTLGTASGITYNGIGWNAKDGYFYGISKAGTAKPTVVRINSSGQATATANQPTDASWPTSFSDRDLAMGDVRNEILYVLDVLTKNLWTIPLANPATATRVTVTPSYWDSNVSNSWPSDIVVQGGIAYGVIGTGNTTNSLNVVAMNVATGATTVTPLTWPAGLDGGVTGAVYRGWNNDMFVTFNGGDPRNLYRIANFTTASPTVEFVRTVNVALSSNVDGASTPLTDCTCLFMMRMVARARRRRPRAMWIRV